MNIDAIANGIVIDHITAGQGMRLYELLGLEKLDCSGTSSRSTPTSPWIST